MQTYFFDRVNGDISGLYRNEQYQGQESLPENDAEIVAWFSSEAQSRADQETKHTDAIALLALNDLSDKTYDQVDTYIDNTVTDLPTAKTELKKYGKIILAMLKKMDLSD